MEPNTDYYGKIIFNAILDTKIGYCLVKGVRLPIEPNQYTGAVEIINNKTGEKKYFIGFDAVHDWMIDSKGNYIGKVHTDKDTPLFKTLRGIDHVVRHEGRDIAGIRNGVKLKFGNTNDQLAEKELKKFLFNNN